MSKNSICFIFIIAYIFFSCESDKKLSGNYSVCFDGFYGELYFKNDSVSLATSLKKFYDRKKFNLKNDTLYHNTFGEFSDTAKAIVTFVNKDQVTIYYPEGDYTHKLQRMQERIDWNGDYYTFWKKFFVRQTSSNCDTDY